MIAIGLAVAGVLLFLGGSASPAFAKPLRVAVSLDIKPALIRLADTQGFFKNQGVDVVIKEYDSGALAVNDLIADRADIATAADFVFVLQSSIRTDLRMPATVCMTSDNDLVVRKDRNITKPQDLKGKRVAITRGTSAEFFFYNYLIFNRIPAGSVHLVNLTPSEMVTAMADGTIDAALCWPPYTLQMEKQLGTNGARWPAQSGQDYYFALFAKGGFLKKESKTMERFLAALADAEKFVARNPERARAILSKKLKIPMDLLSLQWSHFRFQLQLTQDLLVLMEREAKWAIRNKLVEKKEMPNYLDFYYFDALEKVKPEGVSIVH
ncbi:MAG: ABC transporter substrate-binding protein [Deltaproteobacteria bacterium]|nr:ABC transporter substrate-binding protein [Deltaproteobacteria bacterium]